MAIMTRNLGGTGADVTVLGYGAMELRGRPRGPRIADEDAGRLLNAVLDGGINVIDTSPDYGRSEELIGGYLGHRRDEFFLASKCGGGAARGAASQDKNWQAGPLSQDPGVGQRNWETSGIDAVLSEAGMSNMEFVLRFTLSHPGLSTTIVGTSNPVHLAGNIAVAARGPLPADLYEEARKRLPLPEAR